MEPDQKLLGYINLRKEQGATTIEIANELKGEGWSEKDIEGVMKKTSPLMQNNSETFAHVVEQQEEKGPILSEKAEKTISTVLGSLIILLAATISGSMIWWVSFSYEEPEVVSVDHVVMDIQEQRVLDSAPTFVLAGEIEQSFIDIQWVATSSMYATDTQAIFYDNDFKNVSGVTYAPLSDDVDENMIIAELEDRGYAWRIDIEEYDISLSGMAADGPNGGAHGMLKYNSETNSLQTIVISSRRYLNDVCVERGIEWYGEEVGQDGCEIESEFEMFVSDVVDVATALGLQLLPDDYEIKDSGVYYKNILIDGADPQTFAYIGGYYSGDDTNVYFSREIVEGADVATFENIGDVYAKDKNHVFYFGRIDTKGLDTATLEFVGSEYVNSNKHNSYGDEYVKDNKYVYFGNVLVRDADPMTFEYVGGSCAKDKERVYCRSGVISEADPDTFEVVSDQYSKDEKFVYSYFDIVYGADPASCTTENLEGCKSKFDERGLEEGAVQYLIPDSYEIKDGGVYWGGVLIENASKSGLEYLGLEYLKDNGHVFYQDRMLDGADPETFMFYKKLYSADIYSVDFFGSILDGSDPEAVQLLRTGYSRDEKTVYFNSEVLDADAATFEVLGGNYKYNNIYAKDINTVFVNQDIIPEANPITFQYVGCNFAKDSKQVYWGGVTSLIGADPTTFECVDGYYGKDKYKVYQAATPLVDADPSTFEYIGGLWRYAKDGKRVYKAGELVVGADPENCNAENLAGCEAQ